MYAKTLQLLDELPRMLQQRRIRVLFLHMKLKPLSLHPNPAEFIVLTI